MPTWTKRINVANTKRSGMSLMESTSSPTMGSTSKYSSFLPEIYAGQAQRIERYRQYNEMDLDSEISTSLDTIADFSTQPNQNNDVPFELNFDESEMTSEEIELLSSALKQWCRINKFKKRIWKIFRNVLKYGDFILVRDPETFRLYDVAPDKVEKVIVNEAEGKEPYYYVIQGLDLNLQAFAATKPEENIPVSISASTPRGVGTVSSPMNMQTSGNIQSMKNTNTLGWYVNASDAVHLSLSDEMDYNWPFGTSILETVFKTYKQKQLLEDAILIYRIQRAPERRIFKIDVGDNAPHVAQAIVERAKNEVHQKRIPSRTGGGNNILDAAYNPLCLDLNTRIPLLDGRTLLLNELIEEYQLGKENWVYSCDPITGEIMPGNITWAGITRENAETIELIFDNGETLICTPDHKIPVLGKGFVEAQYLKPNDPLISFETREKSPSKDKNSYTQVFDHSTNSWKFVHRMVGEFFRKIGKHQVFVFNEDTANDEKNIVHHADYNRYNNDPRNLQWMNNKDHLLYYSFVKKEYWQNLTEEESARIKQKIRDDLDEYRKNTTNGKNSLISEELKCNNWIVRLSSVLKTKYNNWFKKHYKHRVVSIRKVENRTTGTITVDGQERWHSHHTFAIESGIFVKNSLLEDYFFAVTPEGRGSSVETLPGGENLGQIDDLRYFDNKLKRGLGVPSSYLPSGPDDGTTSYNDGRVGTAYMQEYRFSRFCKRLQLLVVDELDREFKMFLKKREIAIDSSTFNLEFPEPQNFSKFRQMAIDGEAINMFSTMKDTPYLSKRFILERYLGLDDQDIIRNEKLWLEENADLAEEQGAVVNQDETDLSGVGMRPTGGNDLGFDADVGDFEPNFGGEESLISGGEGGEPMPEE